jgi:hypothetical protein
MGKNNFTTGDSAAVAKNRQKAIALEWSTSFNNPTFDT